VLINESAAQLLFGGPAVGRHFVIPAGPGIPGDRDVEVVGVVADSKYTSLRRAAPPTMFDYFARRTNMTMLGLTYAVRTDAPAGAIEAAIREAVSQAAPGIGITAFQTQRAQIDRTIGRERVFARLLSLFGLFALVLAAVGLHGVTSYGVARRTSEIGMRIALGATRGQVLTMIMRQVAGLAAAGLVAGIGAVLVSGPLLSSMLFGVVASDLPTIAAAAALMLTVVLFAGWIPARRAARIDPLAAIRED
jgi:predicted lysophospholipase L1 biosynthesis ABC-type transport system permease subunit